jgi:endoplasmic reticulum-Golgi intermediate compartment protein 3
MSISDRLKKIDSNSTVSKEFRVYTVHGAVVSVATVLLIGYLVVSEVIFNFQVTLRERVHVNATSPRGVEMEFDISFHSVACAELKIDAHDPTGQPQSLHIDKDHHVWKHRFIFENNGKMRTLLGVKEKLELGSTLLHSDQVISRVEVDDSAQEVKEGEEVFKDDANTDEEEDSCGSCYGAGEEGECCYSCDDVKRAYTQKGWSLKDVSLIKQCLPQALGGPKLQEGEGCNVHGIVALDSGGGNLHLAPGEDLVKPVATVNLLELLLGNLHEWNVSHTIHKIRFGPEYPAGVYQLDGETRTISDAHGMYQYYLQVGHSCALNVESRSIAHYLQSTLSPHADNSNPVPVS